LPQEGQHSDDNAGARDRQPRRAGPFLTFKTHHVDSVIKMGGKEIQALPL